MRLSTWATRTRPRRSRRFRVSPTANATSCAAARPCACSAKEERSDCIDRRQRARARRLRTDPPAWAARAARRRARRRLDARQRRELAARGADAARGAAAADGPAAAARRAELGVARIRDARRLLAFPRDAGRSRPARDL